MKQSTIRIGFAILSLLPAISSMLNVIKIEQNFLNNTDLTVITGILVNLLLLPILAYFGAYLYFVVDTYKLYKKEKLNVN